MAVVTQLILASQSSFRRSLLATTGLCFEVKPAPVDEYAVQDQDPVALAQKRSEAKALAAARAYPQALVIGADQVLSAEGRMFDKVSTHEAARERLQLLAGKPHHLHSGLALAYGAVAGEARILCSQVVNVSMPMRQLSSEEIEAYLATGEWQGSVGCYQYENRGVHLFDGADADHSSIVGLPLQCLLGMLRGLGINGLVSSDPPWTIRV